MYRHGIGVEKKLDEAEKRLDKSKQNESKKTQIPLDFPEELGTQNLKKMKLYDKHFNNLQKKSCDLVSFFIR